MRVVYFTRPGFLAHELPLVRALSERVETHLFLELAPESVRSGMFDDAPPTSDRGIVPANPVLAEQFPPTVCRYWEQAASFSLVVHRQPRSLHPETWRVGLDLARRIRALRPDVVHLDDVTNRAIGTLVGLGRLPIVLSVHDPAPHSGEGNWRTDLARRIAFQRARRFILHNALQHDAFCARYGLPSQRVGHVPLGPSDVNLAYAGKADASARPPTVLFFGRLSPYKGLEVLYRAAPLVAAAIPVVRFVVAGQPIPGYVPPKPPVLPGGGTLVVERARVDNARVAELFTGADVVVCPYLDASQSGVVLIAYSFGRPIVASAVGGMPEYVQDGETGRLVPPGDPAALASALIEVLSNAPMRERWRAGIGRIKRGILDWGRIADRTLEEYDAARGWTGRRTMGSVGSEVGT